MVSAEAIARGNIGFPQAKKSEVIQLFGSNPDSLASAAKKARTDWVDLNAGCSVYEITKTEAGAALLKNLSLLEECVAAMAEKKKTSVKIRLGWGKNNGVKIAKACEKAGAGRIAVHGRTALQGFSGKADWKSIKKISAAIGIPILGNGDVQSVSDGKEKAKEAGCEGFLAGRKAMGWPGFFDNSGLPEKKKDFVWYASKQKDFNRLKQQALAFSKGFSCAKEMRNAICEAENKKEVVDVFSGSL
jgi:tRNA-dihydrouridine synthase